MNGGDKNECRIMEVGGLVKIEKAKYLHKTNLYNEALKLSLMSSLLIPYDRKTHPDKD